MFLFVCVSELQVQQSGVCRMLLQQSGNIFHCYWQSNDRIWVAELSDYFITKFCSSAK